MSPEAILSLLPAFSLFVNSFRGCFPRKDTFAHLSTFCQGLLSDLPRKSIEPIALAHGTAVRTLQQFLASSNWDHEKLRDLIQQRAAARIVAPEDPLGRIGIIDETSVDKKGSKTPGVQRQYLGCQGKIDNGIVSVHLAIAQPGFKTLVDADLFFPQGWEQDEERRREASIPDSLTYQPKTHIALQQLRRAQDNGLKLDWMTCDEWYGKSLHFLQEADKLGLKYVCEVPVNFYCATAAAAPTRQAQHLVSYSPFFYSQEWTPFRLTRQTLGPQRWLCKACRVFIPSEDDKAERRSGWLIAGYNEETGEHKYWISNAAATTPLKTLLLVAFTRWNVEHLFRVSKSEVGFTHFEGRTYTGLMRHMILCLLVLLFLAEQTAEQAAFSPERDLGADGSIIKRHVYARA